MADLKDSLFQEISDACLSQVENISAALNSCFDSEIELEAGKQEKLSSDNIPAEWDQPGLVMFFNVDDIEIACLIPESLPLPQWYRSADDSKSSQLQTLEEEFSKLIFPESIEPKSFELEVKKEIGSPVKESFPDEGITVLPFHLKSEEDTEDPVTSLWIVGPLAVNSDEEVTDGDQDGFSHQDHPEANYSETRQKSSRATQEGINRFKKLPVTISVRLAEKKLELGEFLAITPGTLITFDKSCEAPLDLYVNNYRYCTGEAVKIGENFGIKVDEVGIVEVREERVI